MKKYLAINHKLKVILISILSVIMFVIFVSILSIKILSPFKVSIYNYESYLNTKTIAKLKQKYSYHAFTNLDELTRAINNKKAVAGIGSDYQIAQLIVDKKLRKIDFSRVFGKDFKNDEEILEHYPQILKNNFKIFNDWIIAEIKQKNPNNIIQNDWDKIAYSDFIPFLYYNDKNEVIGFEIDGRVGVDNYYQFLIPYFILDKLIVYNIDKEKNETTDRNNIKDGVSFDDVNEQRTWFDILKTLTSKYKIPRVYWTNWFQDNAMIGQFYAYENGDLSQKNGELWKDLDKDNYKYIMNSFLELVKNGTGHSIKESNFNKLVTDGQELVSTIIEPKNGKADISIMYNGDALDAYYGEDNFERLGPEPHVSFIRPQNSYMNIDAWIVSRDTDDDELNTLLDTLNETLFKNAVATKAEIETLYLQEVYTLISKKINNSNFITKNLFNDSEMKIAKKVSEIDPNFYKEYYDEFKAGFSSQNLPFIENFDVINYTPAYENTNKFLREWYFLDENKKPNKNAIKIFNAGQDHDTNYRTYQPIHLRLRTNIIDYYYETTKS
ncbi:hypothetical protein HGG64_01635 [Mycoplasma phocoeninasale]|uniref:Spermidine/putrescine ABC transporter substrate-binding protein n=1 Tax=Mycoplasma phocoeninasale TaxID=2726117 RepID=A0A858U6J7_9MOLU|nr:hypothetical protein [Mycoplasma phocoeninasale]QJG66408.1 hypothetical protein HGG64_01635 [Mycoplasma phocoeninasale]